ncbi:putative Ankyrin repeat [Forsythia ovata]|uniref:Ankyrin repeat n=1 Tax=Forsythia ovata TaxID=205694 RepID=A0ABD1UE27_9LAMI
MLEFALEKGNRIAGGFYALHCAARRGDFDAVKLLTSKGYDVNASDGDGYTPLMLAAREGYANMCEFLISCGAQCDLMNARGETALSLAKNNGRQNDAENLILNALARKLVLCWFTCAKAHQGRERSSTRKNCANGGTYRSFALGKLKPSQCYMPGGRSRTKFMLSEK